MGEYAIDQMILDYKRLYGYTPDRSELEDEPRKRHVRNRCATCGRIFKMAQAVKDHVRDKHGIGVKP